MVESFSQDIIIREKKFYNCILTFYPQELLDILSITVIMSNARLVIFKHTSITSLHCIIKCCMSCRIAI